MNHRALLTALLLALCAGTVALASALRRRSTPQPPELDEHVSGSRGLAITRPDWVRASKAGPRRVLSRAVPTTRRPRRVSSRAVLTTLLLGVCAAGIALAQIGPGRRVAEAIGISSPPESFTALYFTQPAKLGMRRPGSDAVRLRQTVSFAIRSHEHTARTYAWTITTGTGRQLAAGTAAVNAGGGALVKRSVRTCPARGVPTTQRPASRWVQILVAVVDPKESINYWTHCDD